MENTENNSNLEAAAATPSEEIVIPVKVFLNNVDQYQSQAICGVLNLATDSERDQPNKYEIYGSVSQIHQNMKSREFYEYLTDVFDRNSANYMANIMACDYIIYDIGSDAKQIVEVEKLLNEFFVQFKDEIQQEKLEKDKLEKIEKLENKEKPSSVSHENSDIQDMSDNTDMPKGKYFILISTPLTWQATKPLNEENMLYESDYRKRRAHPGYIHHKCIEREVILFEKKSKSKLRTLVVCPGFSYGGRNEIFHYLFKLAYNNTDIVPIVAPGDQIVPLIYIEDFARMIKQLIQEFPEPETRYVFAVEPMQLNIRSFTRKMATKLVGNSIRIRVVTRADLLAYESDLFPQYVVDAISSSIRMTPSHFETFPFTFEDVTYIENILVNEYRVERSLSPIKILVDGPPLVGKTSISLALARHYKLFYINSRTIVEDLIRDLDSDIEQAKVCRDAMKVEKTTTDTSDSSDINIAYLNEVQRAVDDNITEWTQELTELKEFLNIPSDSEADFKFKKRCFITRLTSKLCHENHGYVIDGFPYTYNEANEIFTNQNSAMSYKERDENLTNLLPTHVVLLSAQDELLCRRARSFDEEQAEKTDSTEEKMLKRLKDYHERNEEDTSLSGYFYDNNIIPISFCIKEDSKNEFILDSIKHQIGQPQTYPLTVEEKDRLKRAESVQRLFEENEKTRVRHALKHKIRLNREIKLKKWTREFEQLKREEESALESKTLPLRYYLSKFVLPSLTEGILKVAEVKPEDPIDFLAEFFFKHNSSGRVLSPTYSDELKHILLADGKETVQVLGLLAENSKPFNCKVTEQTVVEHSEEEDKIEECNPPI